MLKRGVIGLLGVGMLAVGLVGCGGGGDDGPSALEACGALEGPVSRAVESMELAAQATSVGAAEVHLEAIEGSAAEIRGVVGPDGFGSLTAGLADAMGDFVAGARVTLGGGDTGRMDRATVEMGEAALDLEDWCDAAG